MKIYARWNAAIENLFLQMAQRSLSFLHNCVQEIKILDVKYPEGAIACWVFLSCLEILLTCEKSSDASNRIQLYCLNTASLWEYAREKLVELGKSEAKCFITTGTFKT